MSLALFSLYFYQFTSGVNGYNLLTGSFIGLAVDNESLISVPTVVENDSLSSTPGMEIVLPPQEIPESPTPPLANDTSPDPSPLPDDSSPPKIPKTLPETIPEENETTAEETAVPLMTQEIVPLATTCNTNIAACQSTGWTNNTVYCLTAHISNRKGNCFNFSVDSTYNITLDCRGFRIDGDDSAGTDYGVEADSNDINFTLRNCNISDFTNGMRIISSVNLSIENSSFYSNADDGVNIGTTLNFSVKRSDFAENGGNGLDTGATGDNDGAVIYNNTFRGQNGSTDAGLYIYRGNDYWNVSYNTFTNNFYGIYDEGNTNNIALSVYKNIFQNHNVSSAAALAIEDDDRASFSENFFDHSTLGLHFVSTVAQDNRFYDNQFNVSTTAAISFNSNWQSLNQNFSGTLVDGQRYYHCFNAHGFTVSNVRFNASKVSDFGAMNIIGCGSVSVENITVLGNTGGDSATVDGFGMGVFNTTNITMIAVNFSRNNFGLVFGASATSTSSVVNASIHSSFFLDSLGADGFQLFESYNITVLNSTFYNNSDDGIDLDDSDNFTLKYSTIHLNDDRGLEVSGASGDSGSGFVFNNTFRSQNQSSADAGMELASNALSWNISYNYFAYNTIGLDDDGTGGNNQNTFVFNNIFFRNGFAPSSGAGVTLTASNRAVYRDNVFISNLNGIDLGSGNDNFFFDNQVNQSGNAAFLFSSWSNLDQNFTGNTVDGQRYYHCYKMTEWILSNVRINASKISDFGAINLWGCNNVVLTNVTGYGNRAGVSPTTDGFGIYLLNSTNITILRSNFSSNNMGGALGSTSIDAAAVINVTIQDSSFTDNFAADGLQILSSHNISIINSTFYNNSADGLVVDESNNVSIKYSSFSINTAHGISLDGASSGSNNGIIFNNTFVGQNGSGDTGITFDTGVDNWNISYNHFSHNDFGIQQFGSSGNNDNNFFFQNTFLRNSQASSGGGGILIRANDGNTYRDNVFLYNTIGIRFSQTDSSDNHFYDNQFNESTLDAFDFAAWNSLDHNFSGNTIDGQRYYHCYNTNNWALSNVRINASRISDLGGINIFGCSNVVLTNVTVFKQRGGASATLEGFGLGVYNTTLVTITRSNFSNNKIGAALGVSGVSASGVANFTIIDSFFSNNIGTDGLQIYESFNGTIINTSIRNNSDDGIELSNSDNVTIKLSSFMGNTDDGLYIDDSGGGIIFNNTFFMQNDSADDSGIFMDDDNDFWNISFNNFSYNYHGLVIDGQTRNNTGLFFYRNFFWQNRGSASAGTGVRIQFNNNSIFTENIFLDNIQGVELVDNIYAGNNLFFRNNFKNNSGLVLFHARAPLNITNQFNLTLAPAQGGNFWDNYNDTAEGCTDANNDGFCDSPYLNIGNTSNDSHPYVAEINFDDTQPNTTFLLINSTPLGNFSTSNILCYANISDAQGGVVSANFTWYNNSVEIEHLRGQRANLGANTLNLIATLNSANLTAGHIWTCSVRGFASTIYEDDWNNISVTIQASTVDTNPPNVTNTSPFNHQQFNISKTFFEIGANATDGGSPVSTVLANVSYPNGSTILFELINATTYRTRFNMSFTIPELIGYYNVTFIANDSNNNFNRTVFVNFSINDNTAPNVTNTTPANHRSFNFSSVFFEIAANVTDDIMISKVYANLSYPNGSALLFELSNATTHFSKFNVSFTIPELIGFYNITFIANDSSNNRNVSIVVNFSVNDLAAPNVTNITPARDSSFSTSDVIEIGANVTDDIMTSKVYANVSYPNGSALLFELSNSTEYTRRFNLSFTIPSVTGNYNITFIANDSSNNFNRSGRTNFTVSAAAPPPAPAPAPSGQRGGGGGQSRTTTAAVALLQPECTSNLDCPVNRYCVNQKCVRIFDLKILTVDSPVQPGDFFDFSYLVKGIGDISGDVTLDFWLEKGGNKVVSGTDVIFIGKNDQRIEATNLFLPTTLPEGKYTFKIQLTYDRYQIVSSRTVEVKVPAEFLLSAEIPDLLEVAPYLSWTYPLVISINRDEAVKTTINQKVLMKTKTGTYTQVQRKQTTVIVSRLAQITQSVKGLKPGQYRLEVTVTARKKTVKIVRDFIVVSPFTKVFMQQIINNIIADAVAGSRRTALEIPPSGEMMQLRNIEDLQKLRPLRNITVILENNRTTVMKLFPKIFQGFEDPFYIVTRRTLGYDDSVLEMISGLSYSRESVAGKLLEAEVVNPEQIILQPGERIEKTITFREGLMNPEYLLMKFVTEEEDVAFEQNIDVNNKLFSGTAVDVDPETDTFEVYTFVVPPAAVELLQEYYAQSSLTGAVIIGDQPQGQRYYLEITMRKKQPEGDQGVVEKLVQVLKTPQDRFVELYGPYDLTDNQIFVFAQQLSYNQKKYSGDYIVEATIFRGTEKFITSEYEISFE